MRLQLRSPLWAAFCIAVILIPLSAWAENWPCWRGPRRDGTSLEKGLPVTWAGPTEENPQGKNIRWRVPVEGKGHASPTVWGDRVFIVTATEEPAQRVLLCLDKNSGKTLWRKVVVTAPLERKHRLNSHASSTPVTDGELVYVTFLDGDHMLVAAYDFDGNRRWVVRPGEFRSVHGYCSSGLLYKNLLILNGDHDGDGYLVALDKKTGETVWKTPRPNHTRSYCPPIVRNLDGRDQLVLSGSLCVASYNPATGERHWIYDGPTEQFVASLVDDGEFFFMTAGFPEFHIIAFRPGGHGKIDESQIVWRTTKGCSYVPSPIVSADRKFFLIASDKGIASCFDTKTGELHWRKRIGPHYSASLIGVDGLVHFLSDEGVTTVVRPGKEFDVVAENKLGERCYASPAVSGGCLFIRAEGHLYCIGGD